MSEFALALFGLGCFLTVFAACRLVLQRAGGDTEWSPELHRSRILTLCGMLGDSAVDAAPPVFQAKVARDERLLQLAGLTPRYRGSDVLGMQALGLCVTLPLTLLVWDKIGAPAVLYPVLGITLPRWFFVRRKDARQRELARDFPLALDMLCVSVGAGRGLWQALEDIRPYTMPGAVRTELRRIIHDAQTADLGAGLRRCSKRVEALELKSVLATLVQAMGGGGGILGTLRTQAEQLRYDRTMRAEEAAQKAPVKMVFPMMLFIFPCVLLVVFGPIVVSMITMFKQASPF